MTRKPKKPKLSKRAYKNKVNYTKQYNKDNYKRYTISVRKDNVAVINKLDSVNKHEYLLKLIEEDIKKEDL